MSQCIVEDSVFARPPEAETQSIEQFSTTSYSPSKTIT